MSNLILLVTIFSFGYGLNAQLAHKNISIAFPSMLLVPDATASGMGEIGVASSPNNHAQFWNPSKYMFMDSNMGIGLSYYSYLDIDTNPLSHFNLSGYKKITGTRYAVGLGINYFSKKLNETESDVDVLSNEIIPNEFSVSFSFIMAVFNRSSLSIKGSYLNSSLKTSVENDLSATHAFSIGISNYYVSKPFTILQLASIWRFGMSISNIGPKVVYDTGGEDMFLPTQFSLGLGLDTTIDSTNKISFDIEFSKLLVPSNPVYGYTEDSNKDGIINANDQRKIISGKDTNVGFFQGILQSFYDAPDGIKEEISEISFGVGLSYLIKNKFSFRLGKFYQDPSKGIRNFITLGAGFKSNYFSLDFSYLSTSTSFSSTLNNTFKASLSFFSKK